MLSVASGTMDRTSIDCPREESPVCQPVPCESCGKTTWSGCGEHIAEVKAVVPADQWCEGHED
ncbi:hypothetical protein NS506_04419 [Nocardia seriolae]|uniref:Uncharacterized protein n=1 Tax=Nocardia seriolae TaxID=37332 RepID=A0ABC8AWH3_9NOCA|nr:hypothetical protein NS506_04419 [Nocardia seriolae]